MIRVKFLDYGFGNDKPIIDDRMINFTIFPYMIVYDKFFGTENKVAYFVENVIYDMEQECYLVLLKDIRSNIVEKMLKAL